MFEEWITSVLPSPLTAPVEVTSDRPWSLVARVQTRDGVLWFKENRGGTRYEAALMRALSGWVPEHVLAPIAVDPARGWSLLPDGGPTLRHAAAAPRASDWEQLLHRHAQLQREVAHRDAELLALGVPDLRPAAIATLVDRLAIPDLDRDLVRALCEELGGSAVPASLQHDDLHTGNVFASGRFFDWGDATVAHPFGVLLVALRVARDQFEVAPDDPLLARLRDAYLEPWSDLADRASLRRDAAAAIRVGIVSRSLSWERSLAGASADERAPYANNAAAWLEYLSEPSVL